ncbi:hypothetical protein IM511_02595 [Erythrobacteraceae bacterium E2-1 Yellow Sea]|nr:hypothetical protein [Erythrobacteraceae bacterium E2-1 Yellow Sea]
MTRKIKASSLLLLVLCAQVACTSVASYSSDEASIETVHSRSQFLRWLEAANAGDRVRLQNASIQVWPGEQLIVFAGEGNKYERCFKTALTAKQIARVRMFDGQEDESWDNIIVAATARIIQANICSQQSHKAIDVVEFDW